MWSLIRKEWRESRALLLGFLVIVPLFSFGLKWGLIGTEDVTPSQSAGLLVPGFLLLFVIAVSSDLVASDAGSGRIAFVAALPVRPSVAWLAKATFLLGAAAVFVAYVVLVETLLLTLAGKEIVWFFPELTGHFEFYAVIAAVGAATVFWSTLIDRGFAAALLGLLSIAGLTFLAVVCVDWKVFGMVRWENVRGAIGSAGLFLAAAFLVGSYVAFTRGRIHLPGKVRRLALGAGVFLLLLLPPTAHAAVSLNRWMRIEAHDRDVSYSFLRTSPDDRWAFVRAGRYGKGPLGIVARTNHGSDGPSALFAVRLEDGVVRRLSDHGMIWHHVKSFEKPGRVMLYRIQQPGPGQLIPIVLLVDYDLEKGKAASTRPEGYDALRTPFVMEFAHHKVEWGGNHKEYQLHLEDGRTVPLPKGLMVHGGDAPWGIGVYRSAPRTYGVFVPETGEIVELPHCPTLLPEKREGHALYLSGGRVQTVPLDGGEPELIIGGKGRAHVVAPDRRRAVVLHDTGAWLVRPNAEPVFLEGLDEDEYPQLARWAADSATFVLTTKKAVYRGRPDSDRLEPIPGGDHAGGWMHPVWTDGRRSFFEVGPQMLLLEEDGTRRKLLPTTEAN